MYSSKFWVHATDVIAVLFGAFLALPFMLILLSPFIGQF